MKDVLPWLLGLAVLLVLLWVLSAAAGLLFWGVVAAVVIGAVVALVRGWLDERAERKAPGRLAQRRAEKDARRLLKDLEREIEKVTKQAQDEG